jgi:hypothetical protein
MKENILNRLLIICFLLAMVSCKARKQVIANRQSVDTASISLVNATRSKLSAIKESQTTFNTFSGKAHTKLDINGSSNDVTMNIRINHGQKIWVSITAIAGIEAARALITPDSILIINRFESKYIRKPFSYIYTYTSRQVDYRSLEALLVGNAIPQLLNDSTKLKADSSNITLSGNLQELMYQLMIGHDMKVNQTDLSNQIQSQSLQVSNTVFIQAAANKTMPSQINITSIVKGKKIQLNLHYIKVDFDQPLEYPFSIPSTYSAAN